MLMPEKMGKKTARLLDLLEFLRNNGMTVPEAIRLLTQYREGKLLKEKAILPKYEVR